MTDTPDIEKIRKNLRSLYKTIGADEAACKGCGRKIFWVKTKNGKNAPFTEDGLNHFADCPESAKFR